MKIRRRIGRTAPELLIVLIILIVSVATLGAIFNSSLAPYAKWMVDVTPLFVALTTFYLSFIIATDRRKREMARWVYTPLLKEAKTWLDPAFQNFSQWGQIKEDQPYLVRRMPKDIVKTLEKADKLFQAQWHLRYSVTQLISEATDRLSVEVLKKAGFNTNDTSANISFYIKTGSGAGEQPVYPIRVIETKMRVPDYADDYAKKNYPKDSGWVLYTITSPKTAGVGMKIAGETEETKKWLESIIDSVLKHSDGKDLQKNIQAIREVGVEARLLIGEELG